MLSVDYAIELTYICLTRQLLLLKMHTLTTKLVVHNLRHLAVVALSNSTLVDIIMLLQKTLQAFVRVHSILVQAQDIKGLLLSHKPTLNPESFLGHLLSALICEFFTDCLLALFNDVV